MKRISVGLVSVVLSILLAARALDLVPDPDPALVAKRVALCEVLAVECSLATDRHEPAAAEALARFVAKRNPEITSIGIRTKDGQLVTSLGEHEARWAPEDKDSST